MTLVWIESLKDLLWPGKGCLSLLYVAKQAQIAMAGGDSIEMLVALCNHKRKTNFSGSSLQDLHDCVASSIKDVLNSRRISHLQVWDKDYNDYVDITNVSDVRNIYKIKVELTDKDPLHEVSSKMKVEPTDEDPLHLVSSYQI